MKKCMLLVFFCFGVFLVWGACSPTPGDESVTETTAESSPDEASQEASANELSNQEENQDSTEPRPEAQSEPGPEPGKEPGKEPEKEPADEATAEVSPEPADEPLTEPSTEVSSPDGGASESKAEGTSEAVAEVFADAGTADTVPETVPEPKPEKYQGSYYLFGGVSSVLAPGNPPIQGVKVCVLNDKSIPCVTSAKDGKYRLNGLSYDTPYYITYTSSTLKLQPTMMPLYLSSKTNPLPNNVDIRLELLKESETKLIGQLLGITNLDLKTKSAVTVDIRESRLVSVAGASVTLSPKKGLGPFYLTTNYTKHSKNVTTATGLATFLNLPADTYNFTFSHPTKTCKQWFTSIPGPNGSAKAVIPAGWLVYVFGECK